MTKAATRKLKVGSMVYCLLAADRGWHMVTAVRATDGFVKVFTFNGWIAPVHFQ